MILLYCFNPPPWTFALRLFETMWKMFLVGVLEYENLPLTFNLIK